MTVGEIARYRYSSSPCLEGLNNEGVAKYTLSSSNACWHSSVHPKAFVSTLKKGRHLSVDRETNRLSVAILSVSPCVSLMVLGGCISRMALILFGLASIPLCETIKPRNLLEETPKAHLLGFSFIWYLQNVLNVSSRFFR